MNGEEFRGKQPNESCGTVVVLKTNDSRESAYFNQKVLQKLTPAIVIQVAEENLFDAQTENYLSYKGAKVIHIRGQLAVQKLFTHNEPEYIQINLQNIFLATGTNHEIVELEGCKLDSNLLKLVTINN